MPDYLLPCTCGQKTAVSTAQAGQTIRCACGADVHVPTMRELRALEQADKVTGSRPKTGVRRWEDRHRAAYLLVVGSLVCLGLAGYLWGTLPPRPAQPQPQDIADAVEESSPSVAFQLYLQMQHGLWEQVPRPEEKTRRMKLWAIGIAVSIAAVLQAGAMVTVLSRSGRRE